jgi:hypothetical protein
MLVIVVINAEIESDVLPGEHIVTYGCANRAQVVVRPRRLSVATAAAFPGLLEAPSMVTVADQGIHGIDKATSNGKPGTVPDVWFYPHPSVAQAV